MDVGWLLKLFKEFSETFCDADIDNGYGIEFARIGEGYNDIEMWSEGWVRQMLNVESKIVIGEGIGYVRG